MYSTDAHCFSCGYDTLLMVGSLMSNHQEYSAGPVLCENCDSITTANYKNATLTCESCKAANVIPIHDPSIWLKDDDSGMVESSPMRPDLDGHLRLSGRFKCPRCGTLGVRFGTNYMGHGWRSFD